MSNKAIHETKHVLVVWAMKLLNTIATTDISVIETKNNDSSDKPGRELYDVRNITAAVH